MADTTVTGSTPITITQVIGSCPCCKAPITAEATLSFNVSADARHTDDGTVTLVGGSITAVHLPAHECTAPPTPE